MDNNNDGPKNKTPTIISQTASYAVLLLEKYGWFVIFGVIISVLIWSKLEPYWRKCKKKLEKLMEETIDPVRLTKCQESQEMSCRRMQENLDAKAAEFAEKMKELEERKRQEKIDDFEMHEQGRGYRSKHAKNDDGKPKAKEGKDKPKKSARLRNSDYNPLTGSSSGSSFQPKSRRSDAGGG